MINNLLRHRCSKEFLINEGNKRIKEKAVKFINGYRYEIIEVDGVEYLSQINSGSLIELKHDN